MAEQPQRVRAVRADRLIDGTGRAPEQDRLIVIEDGRIREVIAATEGSLRGPDVLHLRAATVLPGLIDAHLHVAGLAVNALAELPDPLAFTDRFMRTLLAHGITTVRDTGSPDADVTFRLMKSGRPEWPRFFGSGNNLDGLPGGPWLGLRRVADAGEARRQTGELLDAGVDFIKVYVWMTPPLIAAVVEEAHRRGARVAAHVGNVTTAAEAIDAGVDALEHVRIGRELVPSDRLAELSAIHRAQDPLVSFAAWRFIDPASEASQALIQRAIDRGVFLTPTLCLSESILAGRPRVFDAGMARLPAQVSEFWERARYDADYSEADRRAAPVELARQMELVGRAAEAGLRIVAGTDTPNPFIPPGVSLHHELELLVASGLSPLEAIRAATATAAELIGAGSLGAIGPGKAADLVFVAGDPATEIGAISRITAVMKDGVVVHRAAPD